MTEMDKWQRSMDRARVSSTKAKERQRDIQDLKDAGIWDDPRTRYLDEDGYALPDAPKWWLNLLKAWNTNEQRYAAVRVAKPLTEGEVKQVPKLKKRYKKMERMPKLKHSEKMRLLLEEHGIYVDENSMLRDEFSEWRFCPNGKLQFGNESTISVFYFLQHHADI